MNHPILAELARSKRLASGIRPIRAFRDMGAGDVELGPDGAPKAFRIWKAGANPTDHGVHTFTERSARLLLEEQAVRGNLYSIDVDHLSLSKIAPPESRKAVGFHRLEVRGGDLWAVDVEWTDAVRGGLTKDPPEWRYFSPAYDTEKKTGEIVSYLNTALTNNPATWAVTALASSTSSTKGTRIMATYQDIAAALMGDDDDKKKEARASIAAMSESEKKAYKAWKKATFDDGDGDEKKDADKKDAKTAEDPEKKAPEATTKAAETPGEKEPDGDEATKAAVAATAKSVAKIGELERRTEQLEAIRVKEERAKILATRPDLTKAQLEVLAEEPLEKLPKLLALIDKPAEDPAAAAKVTATRGVGRDGNGGDVSSFGSQRAARLPPAENEELRQRMGTSTKERTIGWDPAHRSDLLFPQITKTEARRILAAREKEGRDGPAVNPVERRAMGGAR